MENTSLIQLIDKLQSIKDSVDPSYGLCFILAIKEAESLLEINKIQMTNMFDEGLKAAQHNYNSSFENEITAEFIFNEKYKNSRR